MHFYLALLNAMMHMMVVLLWAVAHFWFNIKKQVKCSILNLLLFNKKNSCIFCILFCFCISFMIFLLIFQSMLNHLTVGQTTVQTGLHVSAMPNCRMFCFLMSFVSLLHLAWSWAIVAIYRTVAPIGCLTLANRVNSTTTT